jgi:hypothetical protein
VAAKRSVERNFGQLVDILLKIGDGENSEVRSREYATVALSRHARDNLRGIDLVA